MRPVWFVWVVWVVEVQAFADGDVGCVKHAILANVQVRWIVLSTGDCTFGRLGAPESPRISLDNTS